MAHNEGFLKLVNDAKTRVSEIDIEGQPFYWPEALQAFITHLKTHLRPDIPVVEIDTDINAPAFSQATAQALLDMLKA